MTKWIVALLALAWAGGAEAQTLMCTSCVPTAAVQNDAITPDKILAAGQTDEYCLTYEASGDTWAWQECSTASGDVTAVGPSCASGACFTDGTATTGADLFVWEGTTADTAEFKMSFADDDPSADVTWNIPDQATALTFPYGTNTLATVAGTETLTGKTVSIGGTATEGTGFLNFTAVAAGACDSGDFWVQADSTPNPDVLTFCDNGTKRTLTDIQRFTMPLYTAGPVAWQWTDQPSAATFLYGSSRHVVKLDTSGYTAVRMTTNVEAASADGTAQLELQYKTSACTNISSYASAGTTAVTTALTSADVVTSSWQTLAAGAKGTDVCFAAVGTATGSAGDPQIGSVVIEFR